jgi:hypothetical protein
METNAIVSLLKRNLYEVFDERDQLLRKAAIEALFAEDCVFASPAGRHVGRTALDAAIVALHQRFSGFRFSERGPATVIEGAGRLAWAFGPPTEPARVTGLDIIAVDDGRISALYTFLD